MTAKISLPRGLLVGAGASAQLAVVLAELGLKRPLIVTDSFLAKSGMLTPVEEGLAKAGIPYRVFSETVPDPTVASVKAGLAFLAKGDHDSIVGIGGGSPMDTAKAIAVLAVYGGDIADYKAPHLQDKPGLPIIAVPTTAGTGSEATRFTIITNEATDEKMLCPGQAYLPVAALVDYELTLGAPKRLSADTGLDALTHALEAYVSQRANPFSDGMALVAMKAIWSNLRSVYTGPANRAAREAMMLGATQAGIAFSNASVALVHGMSRPIGAFFHVPHGLSNAMLLAEVTAFSIPGAPARYANAARTMGIATADEDDAAANAKLVDALVKVVADLEVPTPKAFGIKEERWFEVLGTMAEQALASGSPGNNPRVPTADEIKALYKKVWDRA